MEEASALGILDHSVIKKGESLMPIKKRGVTSPARGKKCAAQTP